MGFENQYFTIVARSGGNVIKKAHSGTFYYSLDSGSTWTQGTNEGAIAVNAGDKVMFKGNLTPNTSSEPYGIGNFNLTTCDFDVEGNPMSLLFGDDFVGMDNFSGKTFCFASMFKGCTNLISAENLALVSLTATTDCYYLMFQNCTNMVKAPKKIDATTYQALACNGMFWGCTSIKKSPILVGETAVDRCYANMFNGCTNLEEITCLATNTGASNATSSWVANVAPSGTFIGNKNMISWTRGNNGIPTSWVYEDYEFELTFIDLGLPSGTLWCRNNVGAKSACAYGNYYQYGQGLKTFQESSATTQYNGHRAPLEAELDTATAAYGNDYAMPTQTQLYELAQYCNITNQTVNGVTCLKFTSKSDSTKYIYVPAAGYYHNNGTFYGGTVQFWTSTPSYEGQYAYEFNSDYGASGWVYPTNPFNMGFSVRAVKNKGIEYIDLGLPSGTLWGNSNIGYEGGWYYKLMNGDQGYLYGQTVGAISDTATALLGAGKAVPTKEQFEELFANTTRQWVSSYQGGRWSGILYTSTVNGNTLFFPAAGSIATNGQYGGGNVQVSLVCSTPSTTAGYCTNYWGNNTTELAYSAAADRNYGLAVRPVMDKVTSKLYLGDINIENLYIGDLRPSMYLGDNLVFE